MKNLLKCATLGATLCLTTGQLGAAQTNLLQYLTIRGALTYQGSSVTNSSGTIVTKSTSRTTFGNADFIRRLGTLGGVNFSSAAKLVIIRNLDGNHIDIVVQDGGMMMDAGSYLEIEFADPTVETSSERQDTGSVSATRYQLLSVKLKDSGNFGDLGIGFEAEGLATIKRKTLFLENKPRMLDRTTATLIGAGKSDKDGGGEREFIAQLTFTITGGTVEVVQ